MFAIHVNKLLMLFCYDYPLIRRFRIFFCLPHNRKYGVMEFRLVAFLHIPQNAFFVIGARRRVKEKRVILWDNFPSIFSLFFV